MRSIKSRHNAASGKSVLNKTLETKHTTSLLVSLLVCPLSSLPGASASPPLPPPPTLSACAYAPYGPTKTETFENLLLPQLSRSISGRSARRA